MTTYERLLAELGEGLDLDLTPDSAGFAEIAAEDHLLTIRADETGEKEILAFTTVATAPEEGFPMDTLKRALAANLFGRDVVGHHLGLFSDSLVLSATLSIPDLSAEDFAERLILLARIAGKLADSLASPAGESDSPEISFGGNVLHV
ncbi:MAG: type III secretion system chaperone [Kiritimatiellae bacterium]|nr:type III secretion system chaperone [Kiritimatiellia bacterium]